MIGVRMLLEFVFTQSELKILDDPLPNALKKAKAEKDEENDTQDVRTVVNPLKQKCWSFFICIIKAILDQELVQQSCNPRHSLRYTSNAIEVPMLNGNIIKIPVKTDVEIDISEEVSKCSVWKSLEERTGKSKLDYYS
jgi:hypothetical protein